MKVTIIGAGKTGRGFLARLIYKDAKITFIDSNRDLIEKLKNDSFTISFFSNKWENITINGYNAYTWDEVKSIDVDLILISVGASNLVEVAEKLKKYIKPQQKIIVAENAANPAKTLKDCLAINNIYVAESTVFCTTINDGDLDIKSECYPYLQYDSKALNYVSLNLANLKAVDHFDNFLNRKLFTYNSAACIIAYLGQLKGYENFADAANDEEILKMLDYNYQQVNHAMCLKYDYKENDQKEFSLLSRNKFTDRTIIDTVVRNGREPQRKITRHERIVGTMLLLDEYHLSTIVLEKTLAAALLFDSDDDLKWREIKHRYSYQEILVHYCELDPTHPIFKRILNHLDYYQKQHRPLKHL